ncbi:UNVERIFIED_CONTAM: hypothetical protein Sradi_5693600 [Sesamum radiatum]|uniref:Uncharacterized protein n=1 Tax=Sesamum radiatum TaxID=300843 RepID=A0AAW2L2P5_SESRA
MGKKQEAKHQEKTDTSYPFPTGMVFLVLRTSGSRKRDTFRNIRRSIRGNFQRAFLSGKRDSFFLALLPSFAWDVPFYGFSCCCRKGGLLISASTSPRRLSKSSSTRKRTESNDA